MMRHVRNVSETLTVGARTAEGIRSHEEQLPQTLKTETSGSNETLKAKVLIESRNIRSRLAYHHHMLLNQSLRSEEYLARIQDESEMARIDSNKSRLIGRQVYSDNKVTRYLGVLSIVFLPAFFTSAIFSTTFFNFDGGVWQVSDKFWIFWFVSGVLVMATFFIVVEQTCDVEGRDTSSASDSKPKSREEEIQLQGVVLGGSLRRMT
jgi:uncharacterized membrane protein